MEWTVGASSPSELRHTTFNPWGTWPTSPLGLSFRASFDSGVSFAIAQAPMNRFALAMSDGGKPASPDGILFDPAVVPGSGDIPAVQPIDEGARVAFMASNGDRYLVGLEDSDFSMPSSVRTVTNLGSSLVLGTRWPLACGTNPSADATATADGWWVVTSAVEGTFGSVDCAAVANTAPNRVYVGRVNVGLGIPALGTLLGATGTVRHVVIESLADGDPWFGWLDDAGAHVARLDRTTGAVAVGPVAVPAAPSDDRLAVMPFLGGALVARGTDGSVTYVGPDGTLSTPLALEGLAAASVVDALASPTGDAALLTLAISDAPDRVQVARLRCRTP